MKLIIILTKAGINKFMVPSDIYKTIGVMCISNDRYRTWLDIVLTRINPQE